MKCASIQALGAQNPAFDARIDPGRRLPGDPGRTPRPAQGGTGTTQGSPDGPPDRQKLLAPQPAHGFAVVAVEFVERGGDRKSVV